MIYILFKKCTARTTLNIFKIWDRNIQFHGRITLLIKIDCFMTFKIKCPRDLKHNICFLLIPYKNVILLINRPLGVPLNYQKTVLLLFYLTKAHSAHIFSSTKNNSLFTIYCDFLPFAVLSDLLRFLPLVVLCQY
jgi:hypothetical protein